jgi:hypothetical protein
VVVEAGTPREVLAAALLAEAMKLSISVETVRLAITRV